jgi:hypothetical protein
MTKKRIAVVCAATSLIISLSGRAMAAQDEDGAAYFGSFFLSLLQFPVKLATCVGTQTVSAVAYVATFGVPGNYDGGTNGREIGEIARKSCTGSWVVSPDQVKKDYYP